MRTAVRVPRSTSSQYGATGKTKSKTQEGEPPNDINEAPNAKTAGAAVAGALRTGQPGSWVTLSSTPFSLAGGDLIPGSVCV